MKRVDPESPEYRRHILDQFWSRVEKGPDCWIWTPAKTSGNYGQVYLGNNRSIPAHRFSYELAKGPIPDGLVLMHSCDNKACVNPEHLCPGTQSQNIVDAHARGRVHRQPARTDTEVISFRCPRELAEILERSAKREHRNLSQQIMYLIDLALAGLEKETTP